MSLNQCQALMFEKYYRIPKRHVSISWHILINVLKKDTFREGKRLMVGGSAILERLYCLPSYPLNAPSISASQVLCTCYCFCLECFLRIASVIFLTSLQALTTLSKVASSTTLFLFPLLHVFLTIGPWELKRLKEILW